ncbi:MAG: GH3 auxin-responsive promoter family protein [Alphaproteobacteria bacterium]|nr:GH3 auxin-responsive promoter family protein [Alphaproteobacteria bacterium]
MTDFTPLLKLYARRRRRTLAALDEAAAQERQLQRLLAAAANTQFGREHGFASIKTVEEYQKAVRLRRYDDFWKTYWQPKFPVIENVTWPGRVPYFAVTSGTTSGTSKYIPVTQAMNRSNTLAGLDLFSHHVTHRPASRVFGGKSFMLGGSTDLVRQAQGVWSGDLSGIAIKRLPWWAQQFAFPPIEYALLTDWEEKVAKLATLAVESDIRVITGTPSWLLILFDRQQANAGRAVTARDLYPKLDLLVHGGVNFKPYRERFEQFLAGGAELREVYPASEGFIALQDERPEDGLRLITDNGLFFEFVPVDEIDSAQPTRHWIGNVEPEVNYAIVLSTCSGCWSYVIGDTVRFVSREPPRLFITGRTSYAMSAFGEHLIGEEVEDAVAFAAASNRLTINDFSMGAVFPALAGDLGGHLFIVEFDRVPADSATAAFAKAIDDRLQTRNDDYRAHRAEGFGLHAPRVRAVPAGTFARWMKARGRLGGQNKVPRIINDAALFADLERFSAGA